MKLFKCGMGIEICFVMLYKQANKFIKLKHRNDNAFMTK